MTPGNLRRATVLPTTQTRPSANIAPIGGGPAHSTDPRAPRWSVWIGVFLLCGLLLLPALGCGNGISGGSIPPGGSRFVGRVFQAEDPTQPLVNATVIVKATPPGQTTQTLQTTTDAQGDFAFAQVPTGQTSGRVAVSIQPSDANTLPLNWSFQMTNNRPVTLLAALPPATYDVQIGTSVDIVPSIVNVQVGDAVPITAQVRDSSGHVLPVEPSLLFDGDVGIINPDGSFTITQKGSGTVVAFWYGGVTFSAQLIAQNKLNPAAL
jgi:hypothetical protein